LNTTIIFETFSFRVSFDFSHRSDSMDMEIDQTSEMTFSDLKDFLINRMRMSHIYQPVMLMSLLKNGGVASVESLAKDLLINDQSQIGYYVTVI